jgi:coenzyme A diphosphatase NUDT7
MNSNEIKLLREKLPKNPGILGKEEYFNSAVLIPLVCIDKEYHFLFEKRAANIRQGGEICFPGGQIDLDSDKSNEETALRETEEEIGIPRDKIEVIGKLDTLIGPRNVTVDSCVGIIHIKNLDECVIDESEVAKIFSVPLQYFVNNEPEYFKVVSEFKYKFYNSAGEEEDLIPSRKKIDE